jgi:GTP pyrophosphokinase
MKEAADRTTSVVGNRPSDDAAEEVFLDLSARVRDYNPSISLDLLRRAFDYARRAHGPQTRNSGEAYIFHPLEVARILTGLRMDVPTLAAALLHDVIEDTATSKQQVSEQFGAEVAELVDGVTKLTVISERGGGAQKDAEQWGRADTQAENLRKIFLAMAKDVRVILIKLADRLHNLRTLDAMPQAKQKSIAAETLEIFAPLAQRLGLGKLYPELENLSFRYLHPEEYSVMMRQAERVREERAEIIPQVLDALGAKLEELGIKAQIGWRTKHLYSVWRKMTKSGKTLDEIWDLLAVRIIVDTQEECYTALGAVHALWMPLKDRIKDYIAAPKSNRYQSLHTTVYGPNDQPLEIQIRTQDMQNVNEFGIAAHWAYKQGKEARTQTNLAQDIYPWIKLILDWQDETKDAREYIEHLKLDLLASEVFVFTPRGDVIDLPAGSTPIDFAYRIHTDVGHRCVGAKVNTKIVPLDYRLQNADIVDIITSKNGTPSLDWLRICKSSHARNKIRAWYKKERRDENIVRGKDALARELKRQRAAENTASDQELMGKVAAAMNFLTVDDLLAAVGYSEISIQQLVLKLKDLAPEKFPQPKPRQTGTVRKRKTRQAVSVTGMQNLLVKLSRCCSPVHGDEIGGFVSQGRGVIVHRLSCRNFEAQVRESPERAIEVRWEQGEGMPTFAVDLDLGAMNRDGLVVDIMNVLNDARIPTRSCRAYARKDRANVKLSLEIIHKQQLEDLMKRLARVRGVLTVDRSSGSG